MQAPMLLGNTIKTSLADKVYFLRFRDISAVPCTQKMQMENQILNGSFKESTVTDFMSSDDNSKLSSNNNSLLTNIVLSYSDSQPKVRKEGCVIMLMICNYGAKITI